MTLLLSTMKLLSNQSNLCAWAFITVLALTACSCATIVSGGTQHIGVTSMPYGATVTVNPGNFQATTPAQLTLPRKDGPFILRLEKVGYQPYEVELVTGTNGWIWGNILLGGIWILVDVSTGAAQKLIPEQLHANLSQTR